MACHAKPGFSGKLLAKLNGLRQVVLHVTGNVHIDEICAEVSNENCLKCHKDDFRYLFLELKPPHPGQHTDPYAGQPGEEGQPVDAVELTAEELEFKAHHEKHLERFELRCTDCHDRVVHSVPSRQTSEERMARCINCHEERALPAMSRGALVWCAQCHTVLRDLMPKTHNGSWFVRHGQVWLANCDKPLESNGAVPPDEQCSGCHQMPYMIESISNPGVWASRVLRGEYQSEQDFCINCHGVVMPHQKNFIEQHGDNFRESPETCARCHLELVQEARSRDVQVPENAPELVSQTSLCMNCHEIQLPHPAGFISSHGKMARSNRALCDKCHSAANPLRPDAEHASPAFCSNCHGGKNPHGADWLAEHPSRYEQSGSAYCTFCHKTGGAATLIESTFCKTCHQTRKPHDTSWIGEHGPAYLVNGSSCQVCHDQNNSCTRCHNTRQFHPQNWTLTHRQQVFENGVSTCQSCHQQEFCSSCHR